MTKEELRMQSIIDEFDDKALYKELDKKGPFPLTLQGTLEPDAFVKYEQNIRQAAG